MSKRHPYVGLPDEQFWKLAPGIEAPDAFDPVSDPPFRIVASDPIVTAGSCFAQHVARYMTKAGFNHHITEPAHPMFADELTKKFNYGVFSARYGNLYTARQLRQLLLRAYGDFEPLEKSWPARAEGRFVDPFRPQIQPNGFLSEAELEVDRANHFAAIRTAVETMSVFVFTLGLTECWVDTRDGAVFPLAPGVAGGRYEEGAVAFKNFSVEETTEDLAFALKFLREKNPKVRIVLTVSPVPLNATMESRHVYVSTAWSKAVLRVAAQSAVDALEDCVYFPSFEIITSPHMRGRYFGKDCRTVLESGVAHVMQLFFKHFTDGEFAEVAPKDAADAARVRDYVETMEEAIEVLCDEEEISNS